MFCVACEGHAVAFFALGDSNRGSLPRPKPYTLNPKPGTTCPRLSRPSRLRRGCPNLGSLGVSGLRSGLKKSPFEKGSGGKYLVESP